MVYNVSKSSNGVMDLIKENQGKGLDTFIILSNRIFFKVTDKVEVIDDDMFLYVHDVNTHLIKFDDISCVFADDDYAMEHIMKLD